MKVAITGHTRGIGAGLAKRFADKNYDVVGFSRSNGFDLIDLELRKFAIEQIKECDVFVNNFFYYDTQLVLLKEIFQSWIDKKDKYIINIGSSSSYYIDIADLRGNPQLHAYAKQKQKADSAIRSLHLKTQHSWPIIFNIRPGYIDTDMVKRVTDPKMSIETAVDVIMYAFDNRDKFIIKDIVYEPI